MPYGSKQSCYVQKIRELFQTHRNGYFEFTLPDSVRLEVPFSMLATRDELSADGRLSINITRATEGYSVNCTVSRANGNTLEYLVLTSLPHIYMYYPTSQQTANRVIMIRAANSKLYPVPSSKDAQGVIKFVMQENNNYILNALGQAEFSDVSGHWGESEIMGASGLMLVEGYPDGNYQPDSELTRAEFTTMLARLVQHNAQARPTHRYTPRTFSDISSGDWFYDSVTMTEQMGLLRFITNSSRFRPDQAITREEMAYMIAQTQLVLAGVDSVHFQRVSYSDIDEINPDYLSSVRVCTNTGLLQGSGGRFAPKQTLTRAEAAAVLNRLFNWLSAQIK